MGVSRVSAMRAMVVIFFFVLCQHCTAVPWPSPSPHEMDLFVVFFGVLSSITNKFAMLNNVLPSIMCKLYMLYVIEGWNVCESFTLVCCSSGHALNRPAEDDTTPVDDVNVKAAIGSFVLFFTTYGGNADLVYSNGAVLPIVVLLHLFNAVPEAHPHIKACVEHRGNVIKASSFRESC